MNPSPNIEPVKAWALCERSGLMRLDYIFHCKDDAYAECVELCVLEDSKRGNSHFIQEILITPIASESKEARHSPQVEGEKEAKKEKLQLCIICGKIHDATYSNACDECIQGKDLNEQQLKSAADREGNSEHPTKEAYEAACKGLREHRDISEQLKSNNLDYREMWIKAGDKCIEIYKTHIDEIHDLKSTLKSYEERELHHHRKIEEQRKEIERLKDDYHKNWKQMKSFESSVVLKDIEIERIKKENEELITRNLEWLKGWKDQSELESTLKEYEERELNHHRKIEEQGKELELDKRMLNRNFEEILQLKEMLALSIKLREGVEKERDSAIQCAFKEGVLSGQLTEKLERYEKALKLIANPAARTWNPVSIAEDAIKSPQPIEPTVAESAKVQVSAEDALEWCFKAQNYNLSYNAIQREYIVWKLTGPETMHVIFRGETALSAISFAMANEGKKD